MDDPLYVEEEEDDYWYRGYNMRTGERGIFPAFYANEVIGQSKELLGELTHLRPFPPHLCEGRKSLIYIILRVHVALRRNETKPSMDRDFRRSVFGVC